MTAHITVGDADSHPHDAFLGVYAILDVHALSDEIHDPGFALVGNGEGLTLRGVAVGVGQVYDDVNGFAGGLGTLQRNVDQGTVVDSASLVYQLRTAFPGGFGNDELVLVHIAHGLVGLRNLFNFSQIPVCVPVVHLQHAAGLPLGGGLVIKLPIEGMGIGGIRDQHRTVA